MSNMKCRKRFSRLVEKFHEELPYNPTREEDTDNVEDDYKLEEDNMSIFSYKSPYFWIMVSIFFIMFLVILMIIFSDRSTPQYSNVEPPQPVPYENVPNEQYSQVDNNQSIPYPNPPSPPSVNEGKSIPYSNPPSVNEGKSISDNRYTSSIPSDNSIEKSQVDQNTYKEN